MENENACYIETRGNSNELDSILKFSGEIFLESNTIILYEYKINAFFFSVNETEIEFRGCTQISEHDKKYDCNNEANMDMGNGIRICYCFSDDCNK